ncbi:hypothetical protein PCA20602_02280 [Pandoraea capi]|uniref:Uncharacterized protein n=1 Tax=Pandoraea capi TaxID=2508286 RepID=A0ABY6VZT1_9BURK|nr:hypothetical protein [Pandoraea capi]VVE03856.1 hypothetical protein PCA20602_02280 [Pandoraea capi]
MHVPSQPLPGYWPQLSDWQVKAGEAPATSRPATTFTSIRNRLPEGHAIRMDSWRSKAHAAPKDNGCRAVHVNEYTHHVLTALVTPQEGCPSRRYTRNAELRNSVATALALHPQGGDALLEARLKALGLPSLLRDEPQYLPGTLAALRYDVGSRIVAIGRSKLPDLADLDAPGDLALHAAGGRELSYLDGESPHAAQVAHDHKRILDFHYSAAGVSTWQAMPDSERRQASSDDHQRLDERRRHRTFSASVTSRPPEAEAPRIGTFIEHLEQCRQRREPSRMRSKPKGRIPISHDSEAQRMRRKASKPTPPPYPLSPHHDALYNCTLL